MQRLSVLGLIVLGLVLYYKFLAGPSEPTTRELIRQLEGKHCAFEPSIRLITIGLNTGATCRKRTPGILEILDYFGERRDCQCRAFAAICLAQREEEADEALPHLSEYLKRGPYDINTGDGPIPCSYYVVQAIGAIGKERKVKELTAIIDDIIFAKIKQPDPNALTLIEPAILTIRDLKEKGSEAIPTFRMALQSSNPQILNFRERLIEALRAIGDKDEVGAVSLDLESLNRFLSAPFSGSADNHELNLTLKIYSFLERSARTDKQLLNTHLAKIKALYLLYEKEVPIWRKNNFDPNANPAIDQKTQLEIEMMLRKIRLSLIRLRGLAGDPEALMLLPEIFEDGYPPPNIADIFANYSSSLNKLYPALILQAKTRKGNSVYWVKEILKRQNDEGAQNALKEIEKK